MHKQAQKYPFVSTEKRFKGKSGRKGSNGRVDQCLIGLEMESLAHEQHACKWK